MRKICAIFVALCVLICTLTACGSKNVTNEPPQITPKESLALEELMEAKLPDSYCISVFKGNILWTRGYSRYPSGNTFEMLMGSLCDVKPGTLKVESSGIEDGMIYTLCSAELYGDTPVEFLFINDPVTQVFVAGSETTNNYKDYTHYLYYY